MASLLKFVLPTLLLNGALLSPVDPLHAELLLTDRETLLSVTYVFGSVDSSTSKTVSLTETSLDSNLSRQLQGSDSGSGASGDVSWIASYTYQLYQEFTPDLGGGFGAGSSVDLFAFFADAGICSLSAQPGSRIAIGFVNSEQAEFEVHSVLTSGSTLTLDRVSGPTSAENLLTRTGNGESTDVLVLEQGEYLMTAESQSDTSNGFQGVDSWSFEVQAVPEPGSAISIGAASVAVARFARVRRRNVRSGGRSSRLDPDRSDLEADKQHVVTRGIAQKGRIQEFMNGSRSGWSIRIRAFSA